MWLLSFSVWDIKHPTQPEDKLFLISASHVIRKWSSLNFSINIYTRLTEAEGSPCWNFETVSHMPRIKQRSMMILPWSTYLMCFSSLLLAFPFIHWCTSNIKAGILGYFLPSLAASTCLVSSLFLFFLVRNCIWGSITFFWCGSFCQWCA